MDERLSSKNRQHRLSHGTATLARACVVSSNTRGSELKKYFMHLTFHLCRQLGVCTLQSNLRLMLCRVKGVHILYDHSCDRTVIAALCWCLCMFIVTHDSVSVFMRVTNTVLIYTYLSQPLSPYFNTVIHLYSSPRYSHSLLFISVHALHFFSLMLFTVGFKSGMTYPMVILLL